MPQGRLIERKTLRLDDCWTIPIEPEPAQILKGLLGSPGFHSGRINVLQAQTDPASL
jgi:hypothetical protein